MGLLNILKSSSTKKIGTVCDVDIERYLGTWYEIARLDHSFEKGMDHVTATYTMKKNGRIEVLNSGTRDGKKISIKGKAEVIDNGCPGNLRVSFVPFIKSSYRIITLDKENYQYAIVTSSRRSYLWLLSRTPQIDERTATELVSKARMLGFKVKDLIWVAQD